MINLYPRPRIVMISIPDNTIFNLLRKRFATIGVAGAILPIGDVRRCNNFFSSLDSAKIRGEVPVVMKNSLSAKVSPSGNFFACVDVVCVVRVILLMRSTSSRN